MKRAEQKAATRHALADAAVRLFAQQGFDRTTVAHIAAEAGVTERTYFLHFPTKEAAAFPDHDEHVEAFRDALAARPGDAGAVAHLRSVFTAGLQIKAASPIRRPRTRLLDRIPALQDQDARMDRDYEAVISAYLVDAWGDGAEARLRADAVAVTILAVARAAMAAWARDGLDPVESSEALLDPILSTLDEGVLA